jgi:NADH dehydrogenase
MLWTAGVCPPELIRGLPLLHAPDGRVRVDEYLRALDAGGAPIEGVFAIGDSSAVEKAGGGFQPRLAQAAVAMGAYIGDALVRQATHRRVEAFGFHEPGYIISLGQHSSVVELFGIPFSGKLAWLMWAGAYLVKMVGIRKQLEVGIDHITHLFFEHDTSQIMNRRQILSDEEMNLSLGSANAPAEVTEVAPVHDEVGSTS